MLIAFKFMNELLKKVSSYSMQKCCCTRATKIKLLNEGMESVSNIRINLLRIALLGG